MNLAYRRFVMAGLLSIITILVIMRLMPGGSNSDTLAELKIMNQKIEHSAAHLTRRVDALDQWLTARTAMLEDQMAQLRAANPAAATPDANDEIARAHRELQRLKQELAGLAETRNPPVTANWSDATPALTAAQIEAQAAEQNRMQTQLLETTLVSQSQDPDWSFAAENQVRSGLGNIDGPLTINDLVCATTMCRLDASSTASDPSEVFHALNEHLAWDGEIFMTINLDEGRTTAWLGRPGESLPRADNAGN